MKRLVIILAATLSVLPSCRKQDTSEWQKVKAIPAIMENNGDYRFADGKISEQVLRNYLSRSITEAEYLHSQSYNNNGYWGTDDDTRMLKNVGAKFIGRAIYSWNRENLFTDESAGWLFDAKKKIAAYHEFDPDAIFQAAVFETVSTNVNNIEIPAYVFEAFGLPSESRHFRYSDICDEEGVYVGYWGSNASVPDMSRLEAQMFMFYMMSKYIDIGCEAIHLGQVELMSSLGDSKQNFAGYERLTRLIREYAATHARRGTVLLDAHVHRLVVDGRHLLDFCSFPIRAREIETKPYEAELVLGYNNNIMRATGSGVTPSGWYTERLPYIQEFDNGSCDNPGVANVFGGNIWGWDPISWIASVTDEYAREWCRYAVEYMREKDPVGYIQMPGLRISVGGRESVYRCNMQSDECPKGHNLEDTIKQIWIEY